MRRQSPKFIGERTAIIHAQIPVRRHFIQKSSFFGIRVVSVRLDGFVVIFLLVSGPFWVWTFSLLGVEVLGLGCEFLV